MTDCFLQRFWNVLLLKQIPETTDDVRILVQTEMMKHFNRAPICKLHANQVEKYITKMFLSNTSYFCHRSKYLITDPKIQKIVDILMQEKLQWHVEKSIEGNLFLFATWFHWEKNENP